MHNRPTYVDHCQPLKKNKSGTALLGVIHQLDVNLRIWDFSPQGLMKGSRS
jgi:hypothetical protein